MNRYVRSSLAALGLAGALAGCTGTRSDEAPTPTYAPVNLPNLNATERAFIDRMMPHAMRLEARAKSEGLYMPAEAVLTQWANETGYGEDRIAKQNHNFGGIICDKEAIDPDRCTQFKRHKFRVFANDTEGTDAYYNFIVGNKTDRYYEVLHAQTPEQYMDGMGRNGYAEEREAYSATLRSFYRNTPFAAAVAQARQGPQPVYAQQTAPTPEPYEGRSSSTDTGMVFSIEIKFKRPTEPRSMNLPMPRDPNSLFGMERRR